MWNDLNMAQKAELMKIYIQNGVYDLDTVKKDYDSRHQSGDEASLPNYSETVFQQGGKLSFKQWKHQMQSKYPDLEMDNNKAGYDYDTYFKENYDDAIKMLNDWGSGAHFTDRYKLPNHPTFSNESMYSTGVNSGGNWGYDLPWKSDEGYMPKEKFEPTVINQQYHPELYGSHKLAYGTPHNPLEDEYMTVISRYSGNSPRLERVNNKQSYESYLPDYRKLGISDADSAYYYKNNTVPWIRKGSVRTSPHRGIDLSAAGIGGANVYTTGPATILAVNSNPTGGGGRTVTYRTPDGLIFRNMHLQNIGTYTDATTGQTRPLQPGDVVDEGYVIGNVGGSGLGKDDAYGKHLHFETWLGPQGDNVDVNTIMKNFGKYKSIDPSIYNWDEYHGQGLPEASQDVYRVNRGSVTAPYLRQQAPAEVINYMYSTLHPEEVAQSEVDNAHANGGHLFQIGGYKGNDDGNTLLLDNSRSFRNGMSEFLKKVRDEVKSETNQEHGDFSTIKNSYEQIKPYAEKVGNFLPVVGTYQDVKAAIEDPTAENIGWAVASGVTDLASFVLPEIKLIKLAKAGKVAKGIKAGSTIVDVGTNTTQAVRQWNDKSDEDNKKSKSKKPQQYDMGQQNYVEYANGGNLGHITPYGQWQYPHQVTTIPSNNITMQGVDYPVIGVSNTGDTKVMLPGLDYLYDGNYVTEYPLSNKNKK